MASAAVVGSGPNGLTAAIRLAQAGLEVTVFEAHARPGGGMRSSRDGLGLLHDHCSGFHPTGVASPFFSSLDLERHGLRWLWPEIDLAHPLDDGRAAVAARGFAHLESLGADARRWRQLFAPLAESFQHLAHEVFQPPLHVPSHPFMLGKFGLRALLPATATVNLFGDEPAKALFAGVAAHAFTRLDLPLSSAVGYLLGSAAHAGGWPVAAGGSEAISRALVSEFAALGGHIVCDTRISSAAQLHQHVGAPDVVMLDTSARAAAQIAGDRLPPRVRRALEKFTFGPGSFKVDYAIEGDVPWTNEWCRRAGTLHLGGSAAEIAEAEKATVRGHLADRPFVLVGQQYLADPSRSAAGVNPVYAYAHVPHGYSGDVTTAVTAQMERFAPGFSEQILAATVHSPADFAAYNPNWVGGDIASGANTPGQMLFRPRVARDPYSLGLKGWFLCSSATPPGGGVHGMSGFHAAERALAGL